MAHFPSENTQPATAWIVLGSSGQWSDWSQWPVAVYVDEQAAKDYVGSITAAIRQVMSEEPEAAYDENDERTPVYEAWLARLAAINGQADQYDQPHYTAREVPLFLKTTPPAADTQVGTSNASEPKTLPTNGDSQ